MEVRFVAQPYRDWPCGASFLAEALADPTVAKLLVVTAWVRQSGLEAIEPGLRELRDRGGDVDFYIGVDLRGTTIQGLEMAQGCATRLKVVHDPEGRTFHPKIYLATGPKVSYALVGSNNLTAGGMAFNYEGALQLTFPSKSSPDFLDDLGLFLRRLDEDREICKRLTPMGKKRLIADGLIVDEARDRRNRREDRTWRRKENVGKPLFGKSRFEKRYRPPPRGGGKRRGTDKGRKPKRRAASAPSPVVGSPDSWWKQLGPGDAQHPPHGHPTHVVRLTDVPQGIEDRARYFRLVFFRDEKWQERQDSEGNDIEVAAVKVRASIDGKDLGEREVEINYGEHRDVRGRATTVLHWGELLPEVLNHDLTNHYILIERGQGSYALSVTAKRPA